MLTEVMDHFGLGREPHAAGFFETPHHKRVRDGVRAALPGGRLIAVGVACILAAWYYTGGKRPYGYRGLGEVFVFVFFTSESQQPCTHRQQPLASPLLHSPV